MMNVLWNISFILIDLMLLYVIILLLDVPFGVPMKTQTKTMVILGAGFVVWRVFLEFVLGLSTSLVALGEYLFYALAVMLCARKKTFRALLFTLPAIMVYVQWGTNFELIEAFFGWNHYVKQVGSVEVTPLFYVTELSLFVVLLLLKQYTDKKQMKVALNLGECIIIMLFCLFGLTTVEILELLDENFHNRAFNIAWVLFVLVLNGALVYAIAYRKRAKYYQTLSDNYKQQFEAEYAYFKEYKQSNKEISRFRHDWKNHVMVLQGLLEEGKIAEAKAYFGDLCARDRAKSYRILTGNETVDMVLMAKAEKMEALQVEFSFEGSLEGIAHMEAVDICILFSNLVDNALEAAAQCEKKRYFNICVENIQNLQMIRFENSVKELVLSDGQILKTTKEDKENHGIGMLNAREVVQKYDGELQIEAGPDKFIVKLIIPRK